MTTAEITLSVEQTERLAEYLILARFDCLRGLAYGDMSNARRGGELNRRADALISSGVPVVGSVPDSGPFEGYGFPAVDCDALRRAYVRVGHPRALRAIAEAKAQHPRPSKHKLATIETWERVWREAKGLTS